MRYPDQAVASNAVLDGSIAALGDVPARTVQEGEWANAWGNDGMELVDADVEDTSCPMTTMVFRYHHGPTLCWSPGLIVVPYSRGKCTQLQQVRVLQAKRRAVCIRKYPCPWQQFHSCIARLTIYAIVGAIEAKT